MRTLDSNEQAAVAGGLPAVFWNVVSSAVYDFIIGTDWSQQIGDAYTHHSYGDYGPGGNWLPR